MELYQIRYFLAVADTLNFTRAAERANISQPALTKGIQRLEETIGGRLFDRAKSPVQLTELGQAMLPNLRLVFDGAVQAREQARRLTADQKEVVRVGVMCTIDFGKVLPGFVDVQLGRSEVEVSFREGNLEALSDALDRSELDLGIMCSPDQIPRRFAPQVLFREHFVVAIGDDHRFNGREGIELKELHRERYCDRVMCEFSSHIDGLLRGRGVEVQVVQESAREDWVQALVRANFGVAFMPVSIARSAGLAFVYVTDVQIMREVGVLHHTERPLTAAQRAVVDALAAHGWEGAPTAS
jgi:LysR family hydrogen peroxide-inducible transcriptional activator